MGQIESADSLKSDGAEDSPPAVEKNSDPRLPWFDVAEKQAIELLAADSQEAEGLILGLLGQKPNRLPLLRPYARYLMRTGQFQSAISYWERIRAAAPQDGEPRMAIARIHLRGGDLRQALEGAREVLNFHPKHSEARVLASRIAERNAEQIILEGRIPDPGGLQQLIAALDEMIADSPALQRLKTAARIFAPDPDDFDDFEEVPPSGSSAKEPSIALGQAQFIDELAESRHWTAFLDLLEEAVVTGEENGADASIVERHRQTLTQLSESGDEPGCSRARRILYLTQTRATGLDRIHRQPIGPEQTRRPGSLAVHEEFDFLLQLLAGAACSSISERIKVSEGLLRLARLDDALVGRLTGFYASQGQLADSIDIYRKLGQDSSAGLSYWADAVRFVARHSDPIAVSEFLDRGFTSAPDKVTAANRFSGILREIGDHEGALLAWRKCRAYSASLRVWLGAIQLLYEHKSDAEVITEFRDLAAQPFAPSSERENVYLVEIVRRVRVSLGRSRTTITSDEIAPLIEQGNLPAPMRSWILGCLASAQPDFSTALVHFEAGAAQQASLPCVNFQAEIASLYAKYHRFGRAKAAAKSAFPDQKLSSEHRVLAERVDEVVAFCGAKDELLYPECLIDVISEEIARRPVSYDPISNSLLAVSASLDQGGSERQTVTVLGHMSKDPRLSRCVLAVRSVEGDRKSFFLPTIQEMPIGLSLYGENWRRRSNLEAELPGLQASDRLKRAIDLLPHNLREDVIRLCKLIHAERPQAVHVRQDLYGAALACAVAGVPMTVVHRGSLSPDLWGYNELQSHQHLRPMRHVYRMLLGRGGFAIVNNSQPGSDSDRDWTDWPDAGPFVVVYNAYDFEDLGENASRNTELRLKLGIKPDELVIGTAFRFVPVKRPLLWIETAKLVSERFPEAHFLIVGDGPLLQEVRDFADSRGFGHRVHLPGRMSDMGEWYRCMDLNLLTSDREGLPNVLIEGQHFGVPAVAAHVGGACETIEFGSTGYLVPSDSSANGFAAVILNVLRDPAWMTKARKRAPEFVHAKFSAQRTVDDLLSLLRIAP